MSSPVATVSLAPDSAAVRAAASYRSLFGWPIRLAGRSVMLPLSSDIACVAVPMSWAGEVSHHLLVHGTAGPVLTLPGHPRQWVFLADSTDAVPQRAAAPPGVRYLLGPRCVELPPSVTSEGRPRWVVAPDPLRPAMPSFGTLLCAIRTVLPDMTAG